MASDKVQYLIMYGDIANGYRFIGPFNGRAAVDDFLDELSHDYMLSYVKPEHIIAMTAPEEM